MAKRDKVHVVVRWGASVLLARNVRSRTSTLRAALVRAHCEDLAPRLSIANGELWVDQHPLFVEEGETQFVGDYCVEASAVCVEPAVRAKPRAHRGAVLAVAVSALVHALYIGALVFFRSPLTADDAIGAEERARLLVALEQSVHAERPSPPPDLHGPPESAGGERGGRALATSGLMGSRTAPATHKEYAMAGHDPERSARGDDPGTDAASFGIIGLLASNFDEAHDSGWGDVLKGKDQRRAQGEMWGAVLGDSFGVDGLGLGGVGEGGGGTARGVGLVDGLDVFGHGGGGGIGSGEGRLAGSHRSKPPAAFRGAVDKVSGRLPAEAIQRIVRQNFGRFRLCYEDALRSQPNLVGRATVRFLIGASGSVASTSLVDTSLPADASACIVRSFASLSFPEPEGGTVDVVYPLVFEPN